MSEGSTGTMETPSTTVLIPGAEELDSLREKNRKAKEGEKIIHPITGNVEVVIIPGVPTKK